MAVSRVPLQVAAPASTGTMFVPYQSFELQCVCYF